MRSQSILLLLLPLYLLSFSPCILGFSPYYLMHNCNNQKSTTTQQALDQLLQNLNRYFNINTASPNYAFASSDSPSLFALLQCRRDLSRADCAQCLTAAATELGKRCPLQVDAMIWFDGCFLRYSDQRFFSALDTDYYFDLFNVQDSNSPMFVEKARDLMPALACEAVNSGKLIAMGSTDFDSTKMIYGLVQCNNDLTMDDCSKCLKVAVDRILGPCKDSSMKNCEGKVGRRPLMKNCYIQYEQDMFFDNSLRGTAKTSNNCYGLYDKQGCISDS